MLTTQILVAGFVACYVYTCYGDQLGLFGIICMLITLAISIITYPKKSFLSVMLSLLIGGSYVTGLELAGLTSGTTAIYIELLCYFILPVYLHVFTVYIGYRRSKRFAHECAVSSNSFNAKVFTVSHDVFSATVDIMYFAYLVTNYKTLRFLGVFGCFILCFVMTGITRLALQISVTE